MAQQQAGSGPLTGVRVVEMAGLGPAPFACMLLAQLGADVIRVDRPGGGGGLGFPPEFDLSVAGRPAITVDLKQPEGTALVRRLVERADVFVEGFRPGVAERLGLGPADLLAVRPSLVYGRMTGWGQAGPAAHQAGHDINYLATTGVLHAIGPAESSAVPLNVVGDYGGGSLYLVVGVLAALLEAKSSGAGQVVDAAIVDGVAHLATPIFGLLAGGFWSDRRESNLLDGGTPFYDVYATSDGEQLAVGPLEPQFYAEFCRLLGLDDLPARTEPDRWPELRTAIAAALATKTRDAWTDVFAGSDACVTPVLSLSEAASDPHLAARETLVSHEGKVRPAPAPRFSRTPGALGSSSQPADGVGPLLASWGVTDAEQLLSSGVVTSTKRDRG